MDEYKILPETGYIRLPDILKLIPIGRSTWWAGISKGQFPKGIKIGARTTAWRVEDIRALILKLQNSEVVGRSV